jgi:sulfatase modifying factor 1
MKRSMVSFAAVLFAAFTLNIEPAAQADLFGTSGNEFTIDFVNIGNAGNAADTTGFGAVPYTYRIGKYEISQDQIDRATASGMANVTAGAYTGNQPAANITWYEAAAFVNWMNTSTGKQAPYDLNWNGSAWSMNLWSSGQAWTAGGENLFRNKDAFYFLPSENEWYKAAYFNRLSLYYSEYPGSSFAPTAVAGGTEPYTAVYDGVGSAAIVDSAGGLSGYGTMGQAGNVSEWNETAFDGSNSSASEDRAFRGGNYGSFEYVLRSSVRTPYDPTFENTIIGFRVASVPEPSTCAMALAGLACGGYSLFRRRRAR